MTTSKFTEDLGLGLYQNMEFSNLSYYTYPALIEIVRALQTLPYWEMLDVATKLALFAGLFNLMDHG